MKSDEYMDEAFKAIKDTNIIQIEENLNNNLKKYQVG